MTDLAELGVQLRAQETDRGKARVLATWMARAFSLPDTDVTILVEKNGVLMFRHPEALMKCTVPITTKSVAGITFRNNKIYVYNNLTDVDHVALFEKLVKTGEPGGPIQRIISCPLPGRDGPRGVLQVCRKGKKRDDTAAFSREEVDRLAELAKIAGRNL